MTLDELADVAARGFAASQRNAEKDWWCDAVLAVLRAVENASVPAERRLDRAPVFDAAAGFYAGWNQCREQMIKRINALRARS